MPASFLHDVLRQWLQPPPWLLLSPFVGRRAPHLTFWQLLLPCCLAVGYVPCWPFSPETVRLQLESLREEHPSPLPLEPLPFLLFAPLHLLFAPLFLQLPLHLPQGSVQC